MSYRTWPPTCNGSTVASRRGAKVGRLEATAGQALREAVPGGPLMPGAARDARRWRDPDAAPGGRGRSRVGGRKAQVEQSASQSKAWTEAGHPPGKANEREELRWGPEPDMWARKGGGRGFKLWPVETSNGTESGMRQVTEVWPAARCRGRSEQRLRGSSVRSRGLRRSRSTALRPGATRHRPALRSWPCLVH
jgi:hypothetical protein